jgi:hypothetical protein
MGKSNRRIQIVRSSKKHLSSLSKTSADAILELLTKQFSSVEITEVNQTSDLDQILDYAPDLVFLGMEFVPANDPFDTSFGTGFGSVISWTGTALHIRDRGTQHIS